MSSKTAVLASTDSPNWVDDLVRGTVRSSTVRCLAVASLLAGAAACGGGSDEGAADGESWCDVVTASNLLDDEFDEIARDDAGGLQSVLDKISGLGDRFRSAAPDEISAQVETYASANDALVKVFADADYEVEQLDEAAIAELIASVEGVETEIDVYTVAECGVPLGPDDT